MPTYGVSHIDRALTNLSIKKTSADDAVLIADLVAPVVPVPRSSDKYFIFGEEYRKKYDLKKTDRTPSHILHRSQSTDSYTCQDFGAKDLVTKKEIADADAPLMPLADTTEFLTEVIMMHAEQLVAAVFTDTANYASANFVTFTSSTDQWDDYVNSTPMQDILAGKIQVRKSGKRANTIIIPYDIAIVLAEHPNYKAEIKTVFNQLLEGLTGNKLTAESGLFPKLKGLNVLVPSGVVDTSADGATTAVVGDIWGNKVWIGYVNPMKKAKLKTVSFALQMKHKLEGAIRRVYKKEDPSVDIHGTWVNIEESVVAKVIAADTGYLIVDVLS